MAFTTFVYDTLDVCTRLGRYIIQELTGLHNWAGRWLGTALTAGVPLFFVLRTSVDAKGRADPGVANVLGAVRREQSVAGRAHAAGRHRLAVAHAAQSAGLVDHRRADRVMYAMSTLGTGEDDVGRKFFDAASGRFAAPTDPVPWAGVVLIALAALMLVEAVRAIVGPQIAADGAEAGAGVVTGVHECLLTEPIGPIT